MSFTAWFHFSVSKDYFIIESHLTATICITMLFSHMRQHWLLEHIQCIVTRTNSAAPDIQPLCITHALAFASLRQIWFLHTNLNNFLQHFLALFLFSTASLTIWEPLYWCEQLCSLEWESGACKSMALGSWHDRDLGADFSLYIADWVDHGIITEQINVFPPEDSCFHWITKLAQNCNTSCSANDPSVWLRKWLF